MNHLLGESGKLYMPKSMRQPLFGLFSKLIQSRRLLAGYATNKSA